MRVLIIHQHFNTPKQGGALRSYYIAQGLSEQGFDVEVLTTCSGERVDVVQYEGFKIHYLPIAYANEMPFTRRKWAFLKFILWGIIYALKIPKPDLNYVISTPLTTGIIGMVLKLIKKTPFVFETGDLWPLAPIQLGAIRNNWLKRILFGLERTIYKRARGIVALSPLQKNYIQDIVPNKPIEIIYNMADLSFYNSVQIKENTYKTKPYLITYFGTIGLANELAYMLDLTAHALDKYPDYQFIIAGGGAQLQELKQKAVRMGLHNLTFLGTIPREQVRLLLCESDVSYISYAPYPVLETGCPNKFFDALAMGKLIVVNFKGWIKECIEQEKCGFYTEPTQPANFFEQIMPIFENQALFQSYQTNARALAEAKYSKKHVMEKLADFLKNQ